MLKFLVVLYKLLALSEAKFAHFLREMHGPLAEKRPGLQDFDGSCLALAKRHRSHRGSDNVCRS